MRLKERPSDWRYHFYHLLQVKVLPLFKDDKVKFAPTLGNQNVEMENILVYYVDEEAPTFTMKNLSGGIIAVIVVVVLAVVAGLLVLVSESTFIINLAQPLIFFTMQVLSFWILIFFFFVSVCSSSPKSDRIGSTNKPR